DRGHVEDIGLVRHAGDGHGAATPERPDAAPTHFGIKFLVELLADLLVELLPDLLVELLRGGRTGKYCRKDESYDQPLPCRTDPHPSPPRRERGYSGCGSG